ncbi:glycosyltransferase [Geminicoccus roseus]|uniref:glycosyltransferase n=1 Tax=Geminicoccus roseus TaxID=404900 RepID=UPI0003FC6882|nr:glycosyltransferase [Geminicoccus roseus]
MPLLRILMVVYEFPPIGGGTGVACAQLLAELAGRQDVAVDLVTSGIGERTEVVRVAPNIEIHRLPVRKRDLHYWRPWELAAWTARALVHAGRLARAHRYDLCHCWAGWPSGIVGYRLRRQMPYLVSLRGSDVPGYNRRLRHLDPLCMRHLMRQVWSGAARVIAVSRGLRDLALRTRPGTPIDVIPNGVDVQRFAPDPRADRFHVLFVGRLIERKGVHVLLQAFRLVAAAVPGAMLTVVGDGPERPALEAMADEFGLARRVVFRGHLEGDQIPAAYRGHAILAQPALADAMPNVVLEAMAAGLAIVTTSTGGGEVLDGNGQVVPCADPEALADALIGYLTDQHRLDEHRRRSRQLAEEMSWAAVAGYVLQLYREVAAARARPLTAPPREFQLRPF